MIISIDPRGYCIEKSLNVYTDKNAEINTALAIEQHKKLCAEINSKLLKSPNEKLPDLVFVANCGLFLPRLPEKVVLLSDMKNCSRARETPYIERQLRSLGFKTIQFPKTEPFEGQGEALWFYDGRLLVVGYGYRSNKRTVKLLQRLLNQIYSAYGVEPPYVLGVKMTDPLFYHLDFAMLPISPTKCIVHEGAISNLKQLRKYIKIYVIKTTDLFALNGIVLPDKVVVHKLKCARDKQFLEKHTQLPVVEIDLSEFEKSGGSVHCLLFNTFTA